MLEMDAVGDCQEITVHVASFDNQRGSVFYASLPRGPYAAKALNRYGTNGAGGDNIRLVSILWDHLVAMESSLGESCPSLNRAALPIQIVHGPLGRPQLLLGEYRGPAISFSEGGGKVWAALCGDDSEIGIDVSEADEFKGKYPYHRAFHTQELQHALRVAGGDLEKASALLWSIKEAVVKALGCAFHLVDPLEIYVYPSTVGEGGYTFPVGLSRKALTGFPTGAGRSLWVRSLPQVKMWLSIAHLNRRPAEHE
jgi:phosphopantetheinyl transferase (holo-ACP synthase)